MNHEILPDGNLKITVDAETQAILATMKTEMNADGSDMFGSDQTMYDVFEWLTCNSEVEWTSAAYCGILTSGPILGIYGEEAVLPDGVNSTFYHTTGGFLDDDGKPRTNYQPLTHAWVFTDYQVTSPQEELLEKRFAIFEGGETSPLSRIDPEGAAEIAYLTCVPSVELSAADQETVSTILTRAGLTL